MYFLMACRELPPRSFKSAIAAVTIFAVVGCLVTGRGGALLAAINGLAALLAATAASGLLDLGDAFALDEAARSDFVAVDDAGSGRCMFVSSQSTL